MGKFDRSPTVASGLIRLARIKGALTQAQLANKAGVDQQVVSAYETGRREPTLPTLMKLLSAAGFELRLHLEPLDDHDDSLDAFLKTIPIESRNLIESASRSRVDEARLRRVRGR
jgi:transcriptional regulator with XRE-family HTH domain